MGLIRQAIEKRAGFGVEAARIPGPLDGARTHAGPIVNEDTALGVIDVYTNVSIISDSISMMPIRAFRNVPWKDAQGDTRVYARKLPRQPLLMIDPMPGDMAPQFSLKQRMTASLLLNGNSYNEIAAVDPMGSPSVLSPIHPSKIRQTYLNSAGLQEWEMHDGGVMGSYRDGGTMVHIPAFINAGGLVGLSPIQAAMQGIGLTMALEEHGARWFGDGANPTGYLTNKQDVDPDDAKRTKQGWVRQYSGLNREPAYLYGGLEWHPISVSPNESQFIETRQFQSSQMAKLYRVPPHLTGDPTKSTSWGTGIEEQNLGYAIFTLGPWISRIEEAMSMLLPRGQFSKFNMSSLLRARVKDRYMSYGIGRQWGWLSVNDIRELEDLAPIPDGDVYLQPLNMVEASEALELMQANDAPEGADDDG